MITSSDHLQMDIIKRLPMPERIKHVCKVAKLHREMHMVVQHHAAFVLQTLWRHRQACLRGAAVTRANALMLQA